MTVPVLAAAKRLGVRSNWSLSNLEMQKLLYVAHMLHLGQYDEPLVPGLFEAWEYGPVHPALYHKVKVFGSSPVANVFHLAGDLAEGTEARMLDEAVDKLSHASPGKLVAITHWDGGAWAKHYIPGMRGVAIPNNAIRQEYVDRENAARASAPK